MLLYQPQDIIRVHWPPPMPSIMQLGILKKWDAHPDWLGRYDFATARPLQPRHRWLRAGAVRQVKTQQVEYEERIGGRSRLFFTAFCWSDPYALRSRGCECAYHSPTDVEGRSAVSLSVSSAAQCKPADSQDTDTTEDASLECPPPPRVARESSESRYSGPVCPHRVVQTKHLTSRAELVKAFNTLLTMEEQLGGAVRDLDGAGHLWATACKTASLKAAAGKSLGSLGYVTIEERLMALIERTRRAWEQVAITAEYFSRFLGFLSDLERSRFLPDHWEEYALHYEKDTDWIPAGCDPVWAFQLTHVLSACTNVDDIWVSVWHYRPVCEDPCSDINHAVVDAYEFVESLLVQGRVLKKKWGKWHRAYRAGENPVRRTDNATIRRLRTAMRNGSLLKNPTEPRSLQTLAYKPKRVYISGPMPLTFMDMPPPNSFIHLLKGCYEVCTTSLPMSWVLDQDHGDVDVALSSPVSEGKVLVWKPPAVPVSDQPRVWSGTLERRPSDPLKIPGSFPLKSCFVPPTQRPATTAAVRDNRVPADNRHSITSLPTEDSRGTIRIVPEWDYAESEDLSWSYVHHSFSEPYAATAASEAENDNDNNNDDNTVATLVL